LILPFAAFFRFLAWLALLGGLLGAWLLLNSSGWFAALGAAASALLAFVLWHALAWAIDTLAAIKTRTAETANDVERLLAQTTPRSAALPAHRPLEEPIWPNALAALAPVASYNGIAISAAPNGAWNAKQNGETTAYATAADLAAWLKTLPKP
jgi:hypothetical protein